jgi:hypothetical protein
MNTGIGCVARASQVVHRSAGRAYSRLSWQDACDLLTQRFELPIRVADEADPRAALAHLVRRALRLDPVAFLQCGEGSVEVVHPDRDVAVAGAEFVRAAVVVVRQLEDVSSSPREKK